MILVQLSKDAREEKERQKEEASNKVLSRSSYSFSALYFHLIVSLTLLKC